MPKLPYYPRCFVCGDRNPSGLAVRFRADGDRVTTRFTPRAVHTGFHGVTHGGILAALLDETMGWAPSLARGRFCVCVGLSLEYRRPVPLDQEVEVAGWMTADRRRVWETAGEIRAADGTVCVRATGRYVPVSDEQTRRVVDYLVFDDDCVPPERLAGTPDEEPPR